MNMVTIGIIILMLWCMYITIVIYSDNQIEGMNKSEKCRESVTSSTKTCNKNIYTHFGWNP